MTTDTSFPVAVNVNNNEVMSGISEKTFQSWLKTLDPNGIWIHGEIFDKSAVSTWCALCAKHHEWLRWFHNFSDAFVNSITGSALKRDALSMHMTTAAHIRWLY